MSRRSIQVMPQDLALTIAAGEVVERPASVVRELIDNAVDAGAETVRIEIREAGLRLIRVADDGCGIPADEVPLAFVSHATSKIADFKDLSALATLGFRGEALPSIAAVSRVEVQTRVPEAALAARYQIEFGEPRGSRPCSAPPGTWVSVADLFGNVPARRAFVRSQRAETGQIQHVVMQYAMAQPHIHFVLMVEGILTFESPGTGKLRDAAAAVFGAETAARLHAVDAAEPAGTVQGLVSGPDLSRHNRTGIALFVNGRPVANRSLVFALEEAYSGFLMTGRHPLAALHLTLPASEVDVNVHPAKSEVRFVRGREVHAGVHRAVSSTLMGLRVTTRALEPSEVDVLGAESQPLPLPLEEAVDADSPPSASSGMPVLRVFGQSNQTFIIAEGPDGLYMIDQHAAHERVLFDQLAEQFERGERHVQSLLEPAVLDLTPEQLAALDANLALLLGVGFDLEPFGDRSCLVRAVPALPHTSGPSELVEEVLAELGTAPEPATAQERALAMVACKAAIKAGQVLDVREMQELVGQLERTARPSTCPHGRPTMVHLSHSRLEREFGRR